MDILFVLVPLAIGGWIIWWVVAIFLAGKAIKGILGIYEQEISQLDSLLQEAQNVGYGNLSAGQQTQILNLLTQSHQHFNQLDNLHQQRYETRMGDLMSTAASAGIDWSPGSYY